MFDTTVLHSLVHESVAVQQTILVFHILSNTELYIQNTHTVVPMNEVQLHQNFYFQIFISQIEQLCVDNC